jgi:hypothetical protein
MLAFEFPTNILGNDAEDYVEIAQWLIETATLLLSCAGRDSIEPNDARLVLNFLKRVVSKDAGVPRKGPHDVRLDSNNSFVELAWGRVSPLVGEELEEYLPYVLPALIQKIAHPHEPRVVDPATERPDPNAYAYMQDHENEQILAIPKSEVDGKHRAFMQVLTFFDNPKMMMPYAENLFHECTRQAVNPFSFGSHVRLSEALGRGCRKYNGF